MFLTTYDSLHSIHVLKFSQQCSPDIPSFSNTFSDSNITPAWLITFWCKKPTVFEKICYSRIQIKTEVETWARQIKKSLVPAKHTVLFDYYTLLKSPKCCWKIFGGHKSPSLASLLKNPLKDFRATGFSPSSIFFNMKSDVQRQRIGWNLVGTCTTGKDLQCDINTLIFLKFSHLHLLSAASRTTVNFINSQHRSPAPTQKYWNAWTSIPQNIYHVLRFHNSQIIFCHEEYQCFPHIPLIVYHFPYL